MLDDIRDPETIGYCSSETVLCKNTDDLKHLFLSDDYDFQVATLDHDLGDEDDLTGYDFLVWLEEQIAFGKITKIPEIKIHSANPVGRKNMQSAIRSIKRLLKANNDEY